MEFLENDQVKILVNPKGAELTSLYDKSSGTEYMWNGDPKFWAKHSPVLFPIVGTLKEDTYLYKGQPYHMGRHGFARDRVFAADKQKNQLIFSLQADEESRRHFPFDFRLEIVYQLQGKKLSVYYRIINTDEQEIYFSIGGHPAFRIPLEPGTSYHDYYLEFEKAEEAGRWPISKDGLIEAAPIPMLDGKILPLTKELFQKDALVFKKLQSSAVSLRSTITKKGFHFDFTGFPYLGLWAAKDADFVCIEPWCGIADSVNSNQDLVKKEGIEQLNPGAIFERKWSIDIFG